MPSADKAVEFFKTIYRVYCLSSGTRVLNQSITNLPYAFHLSELLNKN